jgi:hypothetical protein
MRPHNRAARRSRQRQHSDRRSQPLPPPWNLLWSKRGRRTSKPWSGAPRAPDWYAGKVTIDGLAQLGEQRVFVLRMLQARDPEWVGRPFFAKYDETAAWFDDLVPAFEPAAPFFDARVRSTRDPGLHARSARGMRLPLWAGAGPPEAGRDATEAG